MTYGSVRKCTPCPREYRLRPRRLRSAPLARPGGRARCPRLPLRHFGRPVADPRGSRSPARPRGRRANRRVSERRRKRPLHLHYRHHARPGGGVASASVTVAGPYATGVVIGEAHRLEPRLLQQGSGDGRASRAAVEARCGRRVSGESRLATARLGGRYFGADPGEERFRVGRRCLSHASPDHDIPAEEELHRRARRRRRCRGSR